MYSKKVNPLRLNNLTKIVLLLSVRTNIEGAGGRKLFYFTTNDCDNPQFIENDYRAPLYFSKYLVYPPHFSKYLAYPPI
jgi:hypothetical protein